MGKIIGMLAIIEARMDANKKIDKEKMNTNNKTMPAEMLEKADADRKPTEKI
jgi:hypothetical protein